jgi:circadian clock protein KaiC
MEPHLSRGQVFIEELDPAQIVPGEFADKIRKAVEDHAVKVVVIDSLTGYFNSMRKLPMLVVQMHEMLSFLNERGVLTMLLVSQEGFMSVGTNAPVDVSYLSDTILLLRHFEVGGAIRRCLTAVKKRQGEHETTIRELHIEPGRVAVGKEPLNEFRSVLSGDPEPIIDPSATAGGNRGGKVRSRG